MLQISPYYDKILPLYSDWALQQPVILLKQPLSHYPHTVIRFWCSWWHSRHCMCICTDIGSKGRFLSESVIWHRKLNFSCRDLVFVTIAAGDVSMSLNCHRELGLWRQCNAYLTLSVLWILVIRRPTVKKEFLSSRAKCCVTCRNIYTPLLFYDMQNVRPTLLYNLIISIRIIDSK